VYLKCETTDIGLLGRNGSGNLLWKIIFGIETADFKFVRIVVLLNKTKDLFRSLVTSLKENFIPNHLRLQAIS
jgi:hypothetical protein